MNIHRKLRDRTMGFFKNLFKSEFKYKINREVLINYINEQMKFSYDNSLSYVDELFIMKDVESSDKLHVEILNYDIPCKDQLEAEKDFSGIQIFVNHEKVYNPETDKRYNTVESFVDFELADYPEEVIMQIVGSDCPKLKEFEI